MKYMVSFGGNMNKSFVLFFFLLVLPFSLFAEGFKYPDEEFAQKNIYGDVDKMMNLLEKYIKNAQENSGNYKAQWKVAQLINYLVEELFLENKIKKLKRLIELEKKYSKKSMRINPNGKEGIYWFLKSVILYNHLKNLRKLDMRYFAKIEKLMYRLKSLDPGFRYEYGAWARLLGRYYTMAPPPPIGHGDIKKSIGFLEKAYISYPYYGENAIYLSRAYLVMGKYKKAITILKSTKDRLREKGLDYFCNKRDFQRADNLIRLINNYRQNNSTPSLFTMVRADYYYK